MARLIYSAIASLDGYIEDERGKFDWAMPSAEMLAFVNDLERPIGTYLYGRRMYETMVYWETASGPEQLPESRDFADIWRSADKVVYSEGLAAPSSVRTRIEREFDPVAVRQLKEAASRDITIGGPGLAGAAIAAGLVDELQLFLVPIIVGAGKPALPVGVRVPLGLIGERRFADGAVYLDYRVGA